MQEVARIHAMKNYTDFGIDVPANVVGQYRTTCPQCSHTRRKSTVRCLSVNLDEGVWNCKHCGWSGTLHDEFVPPVTQRKTAAPVAPALPEPEELPGWAVEMFKSRGISEKTLIDNGIFGSVQFMPDVEAEVPVIAFPYRHGNNVVNIKFRGEGKSFRGIRGARRVLYGYNNIKPTTIIVEGEMDKLALWEVGHYACVSVPDGAPPPDTKNYSSKFSFLDDEKVDGVEEWIIAVDSDAPGKRLEEELSRRLGKERCKRVVWPEDCKDANDVLIKHGKDALIKCIEAAIPFPVKGTFDSGDIQDDIKTLYREGLTRGAASGWRTLDAFVRFRPGLLSIVTGIPNSGKSNWLDDLMVNLAENEGWRFAIFSPENQPISDHASRMIEKRVRKPFNDSFDIRMNDYELEKGNRWVSHFFTWILPDDDSEWTLDTILETARVLVKRKGINGLVIDPWNELEHMRPSHMSETEYISQSLKKIRHFARQNDVHVFVVAHPAKLYKNNETGEYPVPDLYSISGSAHWRNKADIGIVVWRDLSNPESRNIEVHVQKMRFRQDGRLGVGKLVYHSLTGKYKALGDNEPFVSPYEQEQLV